MGLIFHQAKMLCEARQRGVSFDRTLSIGHLNWFVHPAEFESLEAAYRPDRPIAADRAASGYRFGGFSDRFFPDFLDTAALEVLDASAYEGAGLIHDMNQPVSPDLWGRFDAVVDGGSLEHIFNFPVAVANLMRLTKVGGSVFLATPANNLCGHGFYQFSPELMFRVFSPANGFALGEVQFVEAQFPGVELTRSRKSFQVVDPANIGRRVMLTSRRPVLLLVEATKTADVVPFAAAPQQSDYVAAWNQSGSAAGAGASARPIGGSAAAGDQESAVGLRPALAVLALQSALLQEAAVVTRPAHQAACSSCTSTVKRCLVQFQESTTLRITNWLQPEPVAARSRSSTYPCS